MSKPSISQLILTFKQLTEIDAALARLKARQKQLDLELAEKNSQFKDLKRKLEDLQLVVKKHRDKHQEEESRLASENEKLIERRKALATFSNYKVQQSAQKEVEQAAKLLSGQESKLIELLEELEAEEKNLKDLEDTFKLESENNGKFSKDYEEELDSLIARINEKNELRTSAASEVPAPQLSLYDKIRARHPLDPLVPLKGTNCGGCFMQLGPQVVVQLSKASDLIKCRGCGRILFLADDDTRAQNSGGEVVSS